MPFGISPGISFSSIGSIALNAGRWSSRAVAGSAGCGATVLGILISYAAGTNVRGRQVEGHKCCGFEPHSDDSKLKWYGVPVGFAIVAAGVCALLQGVFATGAGRTLLTPEHFKSICANSCFRLADAMVIVYCVIDRGGCRVNFDDPHIKIDPEAEPAEGYYRGEERSRRYFADFEISSGAEYSRDPLIRFQRELLPAAAVWFGLRALDSAFRFITIPNHSVPFFSSAGKLGLWR